MQYTLFKEGLYKPGHSTGKSEDVKTRQFNRDSMVTMADILEVKRNLDSYAIRLASDDGLSIDRWVEKLRTEESVLSYKNCVDKAPAGSGISESSFSLILQVPWQRDQAAEIGKAVLHIDGTHNTTAYDNMQLYTILGRDKWGKGTHLLFEQSTLNDSSLTRCASCMDARK